MSSFSWIQSALDHSVRAETELHDWILKIQRKQASNTKLLRSAPDAISGPRVFSMSMHLYWEKVKNAFLNDMLSELRELFIVAVFIFNY